MRLKPLLLELEFARAEQAGDPFAFRFAPQSYLLRSAGGGFESAQFSWDESLVADLDAVRRPGRSPELPQKLGELLRSFLSALGWDETERQILAAVQANRPIFLTVRSAAAELYALPWELLTLRSTGQHVGELANLLVRYEWPQTESAIAPLREGGERILLAWSAAGGAVPAQEHGAAIEQACRAGFHPFDAASGIVAHASLPRLQSALASATAQGQPIAVLHLLCHGGEVGGSFGLMLDGDSDAADQPPVLVDAGRLRQILAPHAATLRLIVLAACDSGNNGALGNQLGSVAQALHRTGLAAVVASRYPLSVDGSIRLTTTLYNELLVTPSSLEQALLAARTQLAKDATRSDWASVQLYARAADGQDSRPLLFRPYRGLLSFLPEHRRFFFGRDREIAEIIADLAALRRAGKPQLIVVAGASGTGKSSVVLAGLHAESEGATGSAWQLLRMRPGSAPLAALHAALDGAKGDTGARLLVVDQFEELFTHTADEAQRRAFVQKLWALASDFTGDMRVVLTLRVDFIGRCGELPLSQDGASGLSLDRIAYDEAHRVFLARLGSTELRQAIEAPAQLVGLELEEGLASRILQDIGSEPGGLPLVEDTLDLLWQQRTGRTLSQKAYDELGGVTGALRGRADALIDKLKPDEQHVARRLLVRLVSMSDDDRADTAARRRVALHKLRPDDKTAAATFERVLAELVLARLVVCESEAAEHTVEVAHEALIRGWTRLKDWVREDRKVLLQLETVESWAAACKEFKTLLVGEQLGYAKQVAGNHESDLSASAREILGLSRAHERQRQRRRRLQIVGLLAIAVMTTTFGVYARILARKEATVRARAESQQKTINTQLSDNILEQGRRLLVEQQDPMRALIYLDQVILEGGAQPARDYMVSRALAGILAQRHKLQHKQLIARVMLRKNNSEVLVVDRGGQISVWNARTGALMRQFSAFSNRDTQVDLSAEGRYVLLAPSGRAPHVWDVDAQQKFPDLPKVKALRAIRLSPLGDQVVICEGDQATLVDPRSGALQGVLKKPDSLFFSAAYSHDGARLMFTADGTGIPEVWDAHAQKFLLALPHGEFFPQIEKEALAEKPGFDYGEPSASIWQGLWSPDGKRLLTLGELGIRQWFARSGRSWWQGNEDQVVAMAYRRDSKRLAIGLSSGSIKLFQTLEGRAYTLGQQTGKVTRVAFSPDGKVLLAASADKTVSIWFASLTRNEYAYAGALIGHRGAVTDVAFGSDSMHVVTGSEDGTARSWDLSVFQPAGSANDQPPRKPIRRAQPSKDVGFVAAESPRGDLIVTAALDGSHLLAIRDSATLSPMHWLVEAQGSQPQWSADGQRITVDDDAGGTVFDVKTGRLVWRGAQSWGWPVVTSHPAQIRELVRCRVPMEIMNGRLVTVRTDPAGCT